MGCDESKDNLPTLLCFFEHGNEEQKNYCIKLKDHFHHQKSIKFQITSNTGVQFSIQFRLRANSEPVKIQENFDNSEQAMNEALGKMYELLDSPKSTN